MLPDKIDGARALTWTLSGLVAMVPIVVGTMWVDRWVDEKAKQEARGAVAEHARQMHSGTTLLMDRHLEREHKEHDRRVARLIEHYIDDVRRRNCRENSKLVAAKIRNLIREYEAVAGKSYERPSCAELGD